MSEENTSQGEAGYSKIYLEHRDVLIRGEYAQSQMYDKHILTLASGGLALSIIFLHDIAPSPVCYSFPFLVLTWACLGVSVACTLVSFLTSQAAYRKAREEHDRAELSGHPEEAPGTNAEEAYGKFTWILNIASMVAFLLGVLSFVIFASGNVQTAHP